MICSHSFLSLFLVYFLSEFAWASEYNSFSWPHHHFFACGGVFASPFPFLLDTEFSESWYEYVFAVFKAVFDLFEDYFDDFSWFFLSVPVGFRYGIDHAWFCDLAGLWHRGDLLSRGRFHVNGKRLICQLKLKTSWWSHAKTMSAILNKWLSDSGYGGIGIAGMLGKERRPMFNGYFFRLKSWAIWPYHTIFCFWVIDIKKAI